MSNNRQKIECNILFGNNRTLLNIDVGWEGIPFNIVFNTIIAAGLLIAYAVIRWRVKKVGNNSKEQIGKLFLVDNWLPFIYGDKKTNDRITAKFKEIDKRHHLAYLPPILHEYEDQMPEKISVEEVIAEEDASIGFYRHPSSLSVHSSLKRGPKQDQQISNNDIPTVRSELSEKLPDDPYTQLTTEICSDTDEDREVRQLKSVLIHDYVSKEVEKSTKVEPKTPPKPEVKLLDYVKQVIKKNLMITDEKIMKNKGTDAIKYLLFQRYLIYFQTLMTCVCLLIILPINLYGNAVLSKHKFMRTTISNLGNESNLVWIHSLMACIMIVTGYYMTHHFHNVVNTHTRDVDQKTLIIENITKSGRKSSQLFNYFKKRFPKVMIKRITFVYDIRKLDKLDYRLLTAIEAKQYCHRYWLEFGYRCEVRPYCLGKFGGVCLCCGCCPKLDGTLYYAEEKAELKNLIKKEVKRLFWEPVGRVCRRVNGCTGLQRILLPVLVLHPFPEVHWPDFCE
ncbi:uncharacterized protein LOC128956190 [Oppia nitens]|uniref:uncharacterized protein LOC128956190 n=1 Tax=Oppia nitens TaxID=1686743 RepID=UPI0023DA11E5|nr:uncharacterized protein LOC128956190 [Oppia nitens]